jgi:hypothetical protein
MDETQRPAPTWTEPGTGSRFWIWCAQNGPGRLQSEALDRLSRSDDPGVFHCALQSLLSTSPEAWCLRLCSTWSKLDPLRLEYRTDKHRDVVLLGFWIQRPLFGPEAQPLWVAPAQLRPILQALQGTSAVEQVLSLLNGPTLDQRTFAALLLGYWNERRAFAPLVKRMDALVQEQAPLHLLKRAELEALEAEGAVVLTALELLGGPELVAALKKWLPLASLKWRLRICTMLGRSPAPEALSALREGLEQDHEYGREKAPEAVLGALYELHGREVLEPLLRSQVYLPVSFALQFLMPTFAVADSQTLLALTEHPHEDIRNAAVQKLFELDPASSFSALTRVLAVATRPSGVEIVAVLLEKLGDPRAIPSLEQALQKRFMQEHQEVALPPELAANPAFDVFQTPEARERGRQYHQQTKGRTEQALEKLRRLPPKTS